MKEEEPYIQITGLQVFARHGVLMQEREHGQDFYLDAKLYYDMRPAAKSDDLTDAINYDDVCRTLADTFSKTPFSLIEAAAYHTLWALLLAYPALCGAELVVHKPKAPIALPFSDVAVCMQMAWHRVFLGVGSNLGDRRAYIKGAEEALSADPHIRSLVLSDLMESRPYGGVPQGDFLNGCIELKTVCSPEELLDTLHGIEAAAGRTREVHWGPRTLDLDILFYDDWILDEKNLTVPHPDMANRLFVLQPLAQLAPYLRHPLLHKTVSDMLMDLQKSSDQPAVISRQRIEESSGRPAVRNES